MAVSRVKAEFESKRIRQTQVFFNAATFWTSNDHYPLPELLQIVASPATLASEEKLDTSGAPIQPPKSVATLLIAESDVFSAIDKIQGDLIILDINRKLLRFIEQQVELLHSLYRQLINQELTFEKVRNVYFTWCKNHTHLSLEPFLTKAKFLGQLHFLSSEAAFLRCIAALNTKTIITLDINLFDLHEQDLFCRALAQYGVKIKLFNLTNLPDYDNENYLSNLLEKLPWDDNPLILWNIHDRGPFESNNHLDFYTHYPFICHSHQVYKNHVRLRPHLFANLDKAAFYGLTKKSFYLSEFCLRRYSPYTASLQEGPDAARRAEYLNHFKNRLDQDIVKRKKPIDELAKPILAQYGAFLPPRDIDTLTFVGQLSALESEIGRLRESMPTFELTASEWETCILNLLSSCDERIKQTKRMDLRRKDCRQHVQHDLDERLCQILFSIKLAKSLANANKTINYLFEDGDPARVTAHGFFKSCQPSEDGIQCSINNQVIFKKHIIAGANKLQFSHRLFGDVNFQMSGKELISDKVEEIDTRTSLKWHS